MAVVREGSIRQAAQSLNVAPSAISRQISELELRLGLPLLERLSRGVRPTEAGLAIAEHAQQQAEDGERLLDYLEGLHGLRNSGVRLYCPEGLVGDLVKNGLSTFADIPSKIRMQITLSDMPEVVRAVAEGDADVGIAYNPPAHEGIRSVAVARQPLCVVASPKSRFANWRETTLQAVAKEPLALPPTGHGVRQLLARVESEQGFHLVPEVEAGSTQIALQFAASGRGVTFFTRIAAATEIAAGHVVAIPLTDALLQGASTHLIVRAHRRLPKAVETLIGHLSSRMHSFTRADYTIGSQ